MLFSAAWFPRLPAAVRSHAPAARRMTAIPVSRLRPPNVSILFGVAAPPAEDDARAIDDRARASPSGLVVELALRPSSSAAGETAAEGGGRVTLARRACAPRWEFLFRLDAREAATSRGVVTVLDPSVCSHSGGCVLARVELPALPGGEAGGGGLPATRVDPPVAPATVACPVASQSPSRLHLLPSPAAPLWVDRAEALVRDPPRALALSRVAQLLLLLDVCVVALFVLFAGSSRRRRRSRVEMENDLADDVDAAPETRARSRAASPTAMATSHPSPSSLSLSSFSSSSDRGTTALGRAEEEEVFPDDDPPSPSFLPTATPPRWTIVADVDAPCDPHERRDWSISAVVREDLTHGGVHETDLVTAFLAAPPRPCGRDRKLDPSLEAAAEDRDVSFEDDEDAGVSSADDDEDGLLCREARVVVPVPAEKSRRKSPAFRVKMWGRSMPGATARLLLRDLRACAQFAGATMRTFAPGTFESPGNPSLPLSVAPAVAAPGTAASAPAGVPTMGSAAAAAAARGGGRRGWAAAMREFAAPPATAADADATDLFRREGWEGSRRDSKGRLAKKSGAKPAGR